MFNFFNEENGQMVFCLPNQWIYIIVHSAWKVSNKKERPPAHPYFENWKLEQQEAYSQQYFWAI